MFLRLFVILVFTHLYSRHSCGVRALLWDSHYVLYGRKMKHYKEIRVQPKRKFPSKISYPSCRCGTQRGWAVQTTVSDIHKQGYLLSRFKGRNDRLERLFYVRSRLSLPCYWSLRGLHYNTVPWSGGSSSNSAHLSVQVDFTCPITVVHCLPLFLYNSSWGVAGRGRGGMGDCLP